MSEAKKPRRPASGYARGEETRLRIIKAAIERFGELGFESASTRDIAQRAGVNAPALQYYFASKEGLHQACAEYIVDDALTIFAPAMEHARAVLASNPSDEALIDAFLQIQGAIADKILTETREVDTRMFFAREQAGYEPSTTSDIIQKRLRDPLNKLCAQLVGNISGVAPDDPLTMTRTLSLNGQFLVFHIMRRQTFSGRGVKALKPEQIKTTIQAQTRTLLQVWCNEKQAQSRSATPSKPKN